MHQLSLTALLHEARTARPAEAEEVTLRAARQTVHNWLGHVRSAVTRTDPSGRSATAVRVLERSSAGVLQAVHTALPPTGRPSQLQRLRQSVRSSGPSEPDRLRVDTAALFTQLLAVAEAVDALLEDAAVPEPVRETLPWADDQELLAHLWPLLGALATSNGDAALVQLRRLEQTLRLRKDIEMRVADDTTSAEEFDLHPGDEDGYVTVTPALFVRGRLWKRGEARCPRGIAIAVEKPRDTPGQGASA